MLSYLESILSGRKTYLQVATGFAVIAACHFGLLDISPKMQQELLNALILGSLAALRSAK